MDDVIEAIPPEVMPYVGIMFNILFAVTAVWLAWTVFVWWRRSASNLTSVSDSVPNKKAQPDFLEVDQKARSEAIKRGETFEKELERRERDEARAAKRGGRGKESRMGRFGRLLSLGMALFSLATMVSGTLFQVTIMGRYWEQYSAGERLMKVVSEHPIGVSITIAVILYNIVSFFTNRKWEG